MRSNVLTSSNRSLCKLSAKIKRLSEEDAHCDLNISSCKKIYFNEFGYKNPIDIHIFFYRQLQFRSQPGSCLALLANGLETEGTLSVKVCLKDFSQSELSFVNKILMRNQIF